MRTRVLIVLYLVIGLLSAGIGGAYLTWHIGEKLTFIDFGSAREFILTINAVAHAAVWGWVVPTLLMFACRALPWTRELTWASAVLAGGAVVHAVTLLAVRHDARWIPLLTITGVVESAVVVAFALTLTGHARRSATTLAEAAVLAGAWMLLASVIYETWYAQRVAHAAVTELVAVVSMWQPPLRFLQIHGGVTLMLMGLAWSTFLPKNVGTATPRRAGWGLVLLAVGAVGEAGIFLVSRLTNSHVVTAFMLVPVTFLAIGTLLVTARWRWWRHLGPRTLLAATCGEERFVYAGCAWLLLGCVLALGFRPYHVLTHQKISHAYLAAMGHVVTVGFVMQVTMALTNRWLAPICGRGPFVMLNGGLILHLVASIGTDASPQWYPWLTSAGWLEGGAVLWWGLTTVTAAFGASPKQHGDLTSKIDA